MKNAAAATTRRERGVKKRPPLMTGRGEGRAAHGVPTAAYAANALMSWVTRFSPLAL